jgi:hypothetical protein
MNRINGQADRKRSPRAKTAGVSSGREELNPISPEMIAAGEKAIWAAQDSSDPPGHCSAEQLAVASYIAMRILDHG